MQPKEIKVGGLYANNYHLSSHRLVTRLWQGAWNGSGEGWLPGPRRLVTYKTTVFKRTRYFPDPYTKEPVDTVTILLSSFASWARREIGGLPECECGNFITPGSDHCSEC